MFSSRNLFIASQLALFLGLAVVSFALLSLSGKLDILTEAAVSSPSAATSPPVRNLASPDEAIPESQEGPPEQMTESTGDLAAVLSRLDEMESRIADVAALAVANQNQQRRFAHPSAMEPTQEMINNANLSARFSTEAGTSEWGERAVQAISDGFSNTFANKPFFRDYGGEVVPDCRETICSLSWSPDDDVAANMSREQRVALMEAARWQLLALAGRARGGGLVRVATDTESEVPSIQVLVEHDEVEVDPTTIEREYQHFSKITPEQ